MALRVLIAGTSTRAAADSAARAGFHVTALDAFADCDQHPSVRALSLPRDFGARATARRLARASRTIDAEAVVYLSPFENHPRAVAELARDRRLLGNPPDVLRAVRDPVLVHNTLRRLGVPSATVRIGSSVPPDDADSAAASLFDGRRGEAGWMVKPVASGGGRRVRRWRRDSRVPAGCYLQERVDGVAGSVTFLAAGGRCTMLGISRQLTGDAAFGADGYRYCGSMMSFDEDDPWEGDMRVPAGARALAAAVSASFGLTGLNGVDFVVRDGVPVAIEVNPRWSASMELMDRLWDRPLMDAHVEACTSAALPQVQHRPASGRGPGVIGKAVVFARTDVTVADTQPWLEDPDVRDVPWPGTSIDRGEPICTVFATGSTFQACRASLAERAAAIYTALIPSP
jgi:predicted ATP-grasp superfamily ATP-dependent carboligase